MAKSTANKPEDKTTKREPCVYLWKIDQTPEYLENGIAANL